MFAWIDKGGEAYRAFRYSRLPKVFLILLSVVLSDFSTAVTSPDSVSVVVGGQKLSIPAPKSMLPATAPRMIQVGELATIKEDRLLAVFATSAEIKEESKGGVFQMSRYGYAQATRNVEPYQIPLDRFAKYKEDTKSQMLSGMSAQEKAEFQKNVDRTARWIESNFDLAKLNINIGMPRIGTDVIVSESPTLLTIVTKINFSVSSGNRQARPTEMVVGMTQLLVKSKVVWLQLYSVSNSREDFDWVVETIVKWTRAVESANR